MKPPVKPKATPRGSLPRCVRRLVTFHHQSGYPKRPWGVEYWPGDDRFRASLHLHWNWRGRAHWLCVFLPEPNDQALPRGGAQKTLI